MVKPVVYCMTCHVTVPPADVSIATVQGHSTMTATHHGATETRKIPDQMQNAVSVRIATFPLVVQP